ncbi:uncharacterized protein LOC142979315 [Anticarsia gemmatalis]|uniref:uncharacterized protein LOC142979315 n=1 Tax=Anticarsia gemmatalis TaxID=129554 RepID=UPI003F7688B9
MKFLIVLSAVVVSCLAQRSPYAGRLPIGFPYVPPSTEAPSALSDRFGEGGTTTTMRLPIEAYGDAELVKRLSALPIDQQPFWLLNWKALEENRNRPQNFPQRGNSFVDSNANAVFV